MRVFLTGGTGYLGSAVLAALVDAGHDVTAHARGPESSTRLAGAGASTVIGDLADADWTAEQAAEADAVVHAASTGGPDTPQLDDAVIAAVETAQAGTGRAFVYTGGAWALGSGRDLDESSPWNPLPIIAWRPERIERALGLADAGVRVVVVSPPDLYGDGGGLFPMLGAGPVREGVLLHPGSGDQLLSNVHRDDIAALYLAALEQAEASGHLIGASDESVPMRRVAATIAASRGLSGAAPEPEDESRRRLGPLYDTWVLDQTLDTARARGIGWSPIGPALLDDLA